MKSNIISLGEKDRSLIASSLSGQGFMFGCYDGAATITDKLGFAADANIVGTTTGVDVNTGWFTGNGAGRYEIVGDAVVDAVMRLDTGSQLLIAFDYYEATAEATTPYLFSYGNPVYHSTGAPAGSGGYAVLSLNDSRLRFDQRRAGVNTTDNGMASPVIGLDAKHHFLISLNLANGTYTYYIDGTVSTGDIFASGFDTSGISTTEGLTLGARRGATATDKHLTVDTRIANFIGFKPTGTYDATLAAEVASELASHRHEIPWSIESK